MKGIISNIIIVLLIAANILVGAANYRAVKPKCLSDNCNRIRVEGTKYCHKHAGQDVYNGRTICLEVINRR